MLMRVQLIVATLVLGVSCLQWPDAPPPPKQLADTFDLQKIHAIGAAITEARAEKRLPGGVLWLERNGVHFTEAHGHAQLQPIHILAQPDTIYDAASLTKVVATTPAILLLHQRGQLSIEDPVKKHIPEFTGDGREAVTVRHLLTHTSGLRPDISVNGWNGHAECIAKCVAEKLRTTPGTTFKYSDINFQLLDEILRRVTRQRIDVFCEKEIFGPLKMTDTGYNPPAAKHSRVAPTTVTDGQALRGIVHDPRAHKTAGVAGHAGLFTTAPDLAKYARCLLNGGAPIFTPEIVKLMTTVQTPSAMPSKRGLGWDIDTGYSSPSGEKDGTRFPPGSFGHTGFTGPSIWIDPHSKSFIIFLCNRVHPTEKGPSVIPLRRKIGSLAAEAVKGVDFKNPPK
jgi:CubicO group peptidase (beta-lactamase class C family)